MPSPIERKLAAIMFTDIAGYTEAMSKSESKTLNLLEKKRSILKPLLKEYKGTFVKEIGDGTLSYFESAVNAATCAVKLQENTYDDKEMNIRVGIHIGDIVFKDGDVFGSGVNVASRLESIAPAGGVCVSKSVYDELSNQDDFDGIELGLQSLKGVGRLIEVFGLKGDKLNEPNPKEYQENKIDKHSDDEVPSIAIIPFENKGKEEDVFYAYGISADLISDVTSAGLIRVASKKQIDEAGELPQNELAKVLDVRYLANGELWRKGGMFQLSVELYDTNEKNVVWSDRWQEDWDNLTTIKGNLAGDLLKAINSKHRVKKPIGTTNTEAYEYYLRAKYKYYKMQNKADIEIVKGLLHKAIKLDGTLLEAKDMLGMYQNDNEAMKTYTQNLNQAERMDDKNIMGRSLVSIGSVYWARGDYEQAMDYFTRSLDIYEKLDDKGGIGSSLLMIGTVYLHSGNYDKAVEFLIQSLAVRKEIDKKTSMAVSLDMIGHCYRCKGIYDKALAYYTDSFEIREGLGQKIALDWSFRNLGLIYKDKGYYKKALEYQEKSLNIRKDFADTTDVWFLENTANLYLLYNKLGKEYDEKEIHILIKDTENIEFDLNYTLYQLLEDTSYLETAYNQVQELADNLKPDVKAKFLSYPIPKSIGEEWEKVK